MQMSPCFSSVSSTLMNCDLTEKAAAAREKALAPYSGFKVGAALETRDGLVYTGCNIENASYALSDGARDFRRIAIVTEGEPLTSPCGACRQLLWEYCGDIAIHLHSLGGLD